MGKDFRRVIFSPMLPLAFRSHFIIATIAPTSTKCYLYFILCTTSQKAYTNKNPPTIHCGGCSYRKDFSRFCI